MRKKKAKTKRCFEKLRHTIMALATSSNIKDTPTKTNNECYTHTHTLPKRKRRNWDTKESSSEYLSTPMHHSNSKSTNKMPNKNANNKRKPKRKQRMKEKHRTQDT